MELIGESMENTFQSDIIDSKVEKLPRVQARDGLSPDQLLTHEMAKIRIAYLQDQEMIESWLQSKAQKTQIDYRRIANELLDALGDSSLKDATEFFIQSFINLVKHKSPHTQKQRVAIVKALFKFLVKKKYIVLNQADDLKSIEAPNKITERYLSEEEVFRMIDRTQSLRDRCILKLLYGAGLRVGECAASNWKNIQARENGQGQITVVGKRKKQRTVGLSAGVFQELMKLKAENSEAQFIFISREKGRLTSRQILNVVRGAALRAGITKKVSPHWMRHAFASHVLDRGCPLHTLRKDLGHKNIGTTSLYLHARPGDFGGKYLKL
jgi:integrase/recombinase XerD